MRHWLIPIAFVPALMVVLHGCAIFDAPPGAQYATLEPDPVTSRAPDHGSVNVTWSFVSPAAIPYLCENPKAWGCSMTQGDRCVLFVTQPVDFHDVDRLAVMGHEMWHCMGARHG